MENVNGIVLVKKQTSIRFAFLLLVKETTIQEGFLTYNFSIL